MKIFIFHIFYTCKTTAYSMKDFEMYWIYTQHPNAEQQKKAVWKKSPSKWLIYAKLCKSISLFSTFRLSSSPPPRKSSDCQWGIKEGWKMSGRSRAARRKALEFNILALHNTSSERLFTSIFSCDSSWNSVWLTRQLLTAFPTLISIPQIFDDSATQVLNNWVDELS